VLLTLLWQFFAQSLPAAAAVAQPGETEGRQVTENGLEQRLDSTQELASTRLLAAAEWLDAFFVDDLVTAEENTTRARLKFSFGYSRQDDFDISPRLDLRLRLPRLSSRANLFLSATEEEEFQIDSDPQSKRPDGIDDEGSRFTAGLRFFLKESNRYNLSFDTGTSWNSLFAGLRLRSVREHSFGWRGRFTNRLRYYTDDGFEFASSYDLEKHLGENMLFRTTSRATLYEGYSGVPHSQYFQLYHRHNNTQALSYEAGVFFDTEPSHTLIDTQFVIKYRQRFLRDWLALEIAPRLTFPEEEDREANPGIVLSIEGAFGYQADRHGFSRKIP
jgi:hypothetical protein